MMSHLKSRLARLEAVALPDGEPVDFEVCFISPDGSVADTLTIKLGSQVSGPIRRNRRGRVSK